MPNGAPDDPAHHITTAFVRRQHAIDDQEAACANVIGDHAQRFVFQIRRLRKCGRGLDQMLEQVDLVIAVHVLKHCRDALQAHAGIHARRRQWRQRAVDAAIELHEHEVPDLDETIAVLVRRSRRTARNMRAMVIENLGAWSARTGVGHLPEIVGCIRRALVVADADDAIRRQADLLVPDRERLVVGVIDGDQ